MMMHVCMNKCISLKLERKGIYLHLSSSQISPLLLLEGITEKRSLILESIDFKCVFTHISAHTLHCTQLCFAGVNEAVALT